MHFAAIGRVPGDPILGLIDAYNLDPNPQKFDLGVGVYKDAKGLTPILPSVKRAEQRLVDHQQTKTYIGGHGDSRFGQLISELVLGDRVCALLAGGGMAQEVVVDARHALPVPGRGRAVCREHSGGRQHWHHRRAVAGHYQA